VFTVATFIGYQVAGLPGALLATAGIFLPGFVLVAFLRQIMRVVNERPFSRQFLAGVNVAALGLIGEVAIQLGRGALRSPVAIILAIATCAVLLRVQLAGPALVLAGALAGLAGII
jgi:chromate transporter